MAKDDEISSLKHALTVDVEDYFHVSAFTDILPRADWDKIPSRVAIGTHRLLELFSRHGVRATFFILGWLAEHEPALIQEIAAAGHEIGWHSQEHRLVYDMTPDEFRGDVRHGRDVLEGLCGQSVTQYRAPSFSITRRSWWALNVLASEGFTIDSSVFPTHHDRYGMADSPRGIYRVPTDSGPIIEFPPTVSPMLGYPVPAAGGGYFRLFPLELTSYLWSRVIRKERRRGMFYLHPWEVDPDQPRMAGIRSSTRFRHYVGLSRTLTRLERMLERFSFAPVGEVVADAIANSPDLMTWSRHSSGSDDTAPASMSISAQNRVTACDSVDPLRLPIRSLTGSTDQGREDVSVVR